MNFMTRATQGTKLRTPKTWAAYQKSPKRDADDCFMCSRNDLVVIKDFFNWVIVENQFPYDAIAETHHMLIPKRHFSKEMEGNDQESEEVLNILYRIDESGKYDCILKNFTVGQTHPTHFHYHLLKFIRV